MAEPPADNGYYAYARPEIVDKSLIHTLEFREGGVYYEVQTLLDEISEWHVFQPSKGFYITMEGARMDKPMKLRQIISLTRGATLKDPYHPFTLQMQSLAREILGSELDYANRRVGELESYIAALDLQ